MNRVLSNTYGSLTITNIFIKSSIGVLNLFRSLVNHIPSQIPCVLALNYALALL